VVRAFNRTRLVNRRKSRRGRGRYYNISIAPSLQSAKTESIVKLASNFWRLWPYIDIGDNFTHAFSMTGNP